MAKIVVGTAVVRLTVEGASSPVLQNLGGGTIYIDHDPAVTAATGMKVAVGATFSFLEPISEDGGAVYLVSDAAGTDVRYMV